VSARETAAGSGTKQQLEPQDKLSQKINGTGGNELCWIDGGRS